MPVIINGSTGISGTDGSAGTPALQGTDGNTGMFFPAADQIAFAEGGVEAMRLDANGNVGIGVTAPVTRLHVRPASNQNFHVAGAISLSNAVVLAGVNDANSANTPLEIRYATNIAFYDAGTERARIASGGDFQFNSGYGSVATAFGCRAWVNFNGTGTVAIRASGNVSSISDNGTGDYTVNFTNAMPDVNYSLAGMVGGTNSAYGIRDYSDGTARTTSAFRFAAANTATLTLLDPVQVNIAVFR